MSRKVIYVSHMRLTKRVARDWYIDALIARGATVEYWDVVEAIREPHEEVDSITPEYLRPFRHLSDVDAALRAPENRDAVFVMLITYVGATTNIYRLLSEHRCRMVFISRGAMPTSPAPAWKKIIARYASPRWLARTAVGMFKARVMRSSGRVQPFDIVFAAGAVALRSADARRLIPINAVDFDEFQRVRPLDARIVAPPYAVFLDINLPFQSDLALLGMPAVSPDAYFHSLTRFFDLVETTCNVRVVIASHPKAAYGSERFGGRPTFRGRTAELVRDSAVVLTHTSTSLSYAVLNRKPVLFLHTQEMARLYKDNVMRELRNFADYLGAPVVNVDKVSEAGELTILPVDTSRYVRYAYDFLTSPASEQTSAAEVFCGEVLRAGAMNGRAST